MSELNSSLPAWAAVAAHAKDMAKVHLRDLAGADAKRWQNFHVEHDTWLLDISRQRITHQSLSLLLDLARAVDLSDRIAAMFRGDPINSTEKRAVLHTALRSDFAGSPAIQAEVKASRQKLRSYVAAVRSGQKLGVTGKKFRHVVNIGIGGSDLGPLLVCDALRAEWSGDITPHFVSNVDRTQLEDLTRTLDPAETLVIVCSKTFVTQETQTNANAARAWIVGALGEKAPGNHFVAVSTNAEAMDKFGIAPDHRFTMWDWVGGRYSVWSAIGLIAEIVIGSERFEEFLKGASDIDKHFTTAPFEQNLPVLMGLLGVWNRTFLNLPTLAVLPYDQRLARLPAYLQQLEMESNGKSVSLGGTARRFRHGADRLGRTRLERTAFVLSNAASGHLDRGARFHRAAARFLGRHRRTGSGLEELLCAVAGVCLRLSAAGSRGGYAQGRRQRGGDRPHRHPSRARGQSPEFPAHVSADHGALPRRDPGLVRAQRIRAGHDLGRELLRSIRRGVGQEIGGGDRHDGSQGAARGGRRRHRRFDQLRRDASIGFW